MATETLTLDPGTAQLELSTGTDGFLLRSIASPTPSRKRVEATSQDTEGAVQVASQYDNRVVTLVVRATAATTRAAWYTKLQKLQMKVGKINSEGGILKRILVGGATTVYYDLLDASADIDFDAARYMISMDVDITVTFLAKPFVRGDEIALSSHSETTLPCLIFTETGIKGDVPATGRLVITDASGKSQNAMWWGEQSRHYDPAVTAQLFYEAEKLTLQDTAVTTAMGTKATPAAGFNAVEHNTLPGGTWCPVLSTDIVASGKMTHKGNFQVLARCLAPLLQQSVQVKFSYGLGDLTSFKVNAPATLGSYNSFQILDLGKMQLGTSSQWTGVIQALAASTNDSIYIDSIMLIPLDEGCGSAEATISPAATLLEVTKEPATGADQVMASWGGTTVWTNPMGAAGSGQASQPSNPGPGALQTHGLKTTAYGFSIPLGATIAGITLTVSRVQSVGGTQTIKDAHVQLLKAGFVTGTDKANTTLNWPLAYSNAIYGGPNDLWGTTWTPAQINASDFGATMSIFQWPNSMGLVDALWLDVYYIVGTPSAPDAVIQASRSMQIASDGVTRQNAAGTFSVPESAYQGDYLTVPPAGIEGRSTRFIVKASQMSPANQNADVAVDDISAVLNYTPRWLQAPSS